MRDINNTMFKLSRIEFYIGEENLIRVSALKNFSRKLAIVEMMTNPINHEALLLNGIDTKNNEFCLN